MKKGSSGEGFPYVTLKYILMLLETEQHRMKAETLLGQIRVLKLYYLFIFDVSSGQYRIGQEKYLEPI